MILPQLENPALYILDVAAHGIVHHFADVGVFAEEPRREAVVHPEHIVHHEHLAVGTTAGSDTDYRYG